MMVVFSPPRGQVSGKKADVVLQFTPEEGPLLRGLELHGVGIWDRRDGSGMFVTFPGREYTKDGQRKTFDFVRYTNASDRAQLEHLKGLILEQYQDWARGGR
jgi:hypothetical protein